MTEPLEFTGERFTPECVREIWYEHLHRYAFARPLVCGLTVLDAACGEGYGSALLASAAAHVDGVDVDADAAAHARQRYGDRDNLEFHEADVTRLPFEDDRFDRIVSFETLEHLEAQDEMLAEFRRVLRPDGVLILSSPDRAEYTDRHGNDNPHHVRELYRDELEALLARHFPAVRLYGQKLAFHSAIWRLEGARSVAFQQAREEEVSDAAGVPRTPMYFIGLCAAEAALLPDPAADLWLFDDASESVYEHYQGEIRRNMAAGGIIADRDREIERLRAELEALQAVAAEPATPRANDGRSEAPARPGPGADGWWQRLFRRGRPGG